MAWFKKKEDKEYQIKKLVDELEEAKRLTPSIGEFFADQDYSCLWEDEPEDAGLRAFIPIGTFIAVIVLIILVVAKVK